MLFIAQVAAVSCADTQVPETTVANQSLLKVGFCKASQLEVLVIKVEASFRLFEAVALCLKLNPFNLADWDLVIAPDDSCAARRRHWRERQVGNRDRREPRRVGS
jgi:hypothetical protein